MKYVIDLHTEDYRGDHGADVLVSREVVSGETVDALVSRVLKRPVDKIVIRLVQPDGTDPRDNVKEGNPDER